MGWLCSRDPKFWGQADWELIWIPHVLEMTQLGGHLGPPFFWDDPARRMIPHGVALQ